MRFSTLTVVVFVAHTSTQAIAAPLPFSDEIQELVARGDDGGASSSSGSGAPPSSASANWANVASRVAKSVPPQLLNLPVKSNFGSVVQKAVSAAANAGQPQSHIRPRPGGLTPSTPIVQKRPSVMEALQKNNPNAFNRVAQGGIGTSAFRDAVERFQKAKTNPVTNAVEAFKKSKQASTSSHQASTSRSPAHQAPSSSRQGSTARKAPSSAKAAQAQKIQKQHKASSASHTKKVAQVSQARKANQMRKAVAGKPAAPKAAKVVKGPKLRVRGLEIDELD